MRLCVKPNQSDGWDIVDMNTKAVVRGGYVRYKDAYRMMDRVEITPEVTTQTRPCMTCQKPFESEGKHNRMCKYCRAHANDMGMI